MSEEKATAPEAANISPEELAALRKQAAERNEYLDLARRTQAEFENYQKRSSKERDQERKYGIGSLLQDLLPILDNLERALGAAQQANETGSLVQGVQMVQSQFLEQLKRQGVTRIDAAAKAFDPNIHQAVMQQPKDDVEANTILQVLENGYMIHDRVLRPAKVIVSK
ncbi:MAG: nucleotide exchange factor GrpE [Gemmataceae bacterium]|nr:nucleotide exchange factor GrpE [Gemmataceae bacterium]